MKSCLAFFLLVGLFYLIIRGGLFLFRYLKAHEKENRRAGFATVERDENVRAQFRYAPDEWKTVLEKEFFEDARGTRFFEAHSAIVRRSDSEAEPTAGEVFFAADKIFVTNQVHQKIYKLNTFDRAVALREVGVLNTSPLKILRLRVLIALEESDTEEIFHVPLPAAASAQIEEIVGFYQDIIAQRFVA